MMLRTHSWTMEPDSDSISKSDILRRIITEKLSAAAREILAVVERTVADYEEEAAGFRQEIDRQRRLLELLQPEIKLEADDQQVFSLCEAGGGQLPEDKEQDKYELRLEDSGNLGYQAPIEEDDCQYLEQEEEHVIELDYAMPSRLFPQTVQIKRRRKDGRPHSDPTDLSIRILENSKIKVVSQYVFNQYPSRKLKVPHGLREAEFLDLLKSTFPQLADEPFGFFFCRKNRKLKPLKVNSLTPEEINRVYGNSTIYIRLQREDADEEPDEDPPSTPDTISHNTGVAADETISTSQPLTETDTHITLKSRILEDPQVDITSPIGLEDSGSLGYQAPIEEDDCQYLEQEEQHMTELDYAMPSRLFPQTVQTKRIRKKRHPNSDPSDLSIRILENSKHKFASTYVYRKYPLQKLKVPLGLQEAEFLDLLKSTFPQLADEPFDLLFGGKHRKLKLLKVNSLTPEEINRVYGNSTIFIRLQREDADEEPDEDPPSTPDTISHNTGVAADETIPTSQPLTETDTYITLKIYILDDPQVDITSPIVFQNCQSHELQVPSGLHEADFLALLRSTFPQLADGFTILSAHGRKLHPLRVKSVTAEEIYRTSRSTGNPVIFIQLKGPEKTFPLREVGAEDPPSTPDRTTPNTPDRTTPDTPDRTTPNTPDRTTPNTPDRTTPDTPDRTTPNTDAIKLLDEDLRCIILRALPAISEDTQQALIDKLLTNGLESTQNLKHVTQEDIGNLLPALQLQKLLEEFKNETELGSTPSSVLPLTSQESSSSENCGKAALFKKHWTDSFTVPWKFMPEEIQAAVLEGRRPSRAARRQMVRVLVEKIRRYDANPSRSEFVIICQKIIRRYPQSFADLYDNDRLLGNGYNSLLGQIMYQNDKLNRTSNAASQCSAGLDPSLPPEETDVTVARKRQRLEEISCQDGGNVAEEDEVTELMKVTFSLQRRQINALPAPPISDLRGRWPHLFTQNGLYAHFELLTDIRVLRNLEIAMEECGRAILELFSESTNPDIQAILSLGPNYELSFCIIQLLMAHFTEDLEGLILFADASATAADVEKTFQLPASPRLILLAESPGSSIHRWMVSLEGNVICEGIQPTFLSGLAAVFSTYYIFNLQYQDNAACTLEFIQRRFIGINPDRGTKGKVLSEQTAELAKEETTTPINPRVLTLLNKLTDMNVGVYTLTAMFPSL